MGFVSASELAQLQADVASNFSSTAVWKRRVTADDNEGGQTSTLSTVNAALPCYITKLNQGDVINLIAANVQVRDFWQASLPIGTALMIGDQLVVNGLKLEVQSIRQAFTNTIKVKAVCVVVQ